jgi:hypothetical protein
MVRGVTKDRVLIEVKGNESTRPVYRNLLLPLESHARIIVQMLANRAFPAAPGILVGVECKNQNRED